MTLFDALAGGVLLISCLLGLVRGATREVTTLLALLISLFIAAFAARFATPIVAHAVHIDWMARALAMLGVFVLTYVALRTLGGALTAGVHGAGLSGPDRILGLGVGLARGLLVMGVIGVLINAAIPSERIPSWISRGRLYPLTQGAGAVLKSAAPRGLKMTRELAPMIASQSRPAAPSAHPDHNP